MFQPVQPDLRFYAHRKGLGRFPKIWPEYGPHPHGFNTKLPSEMANAKKVRIQIVNPHAGCGHTNLEHARRYVKRGAARWTEDGRLEFVRAIAKAAPRGPEFQITIGFVVCDSGLSGFNRYPMPSGVTGGLAAQFPGLARMGA